MGRDLSRSRHREGLNEAAKTILTAGPSTTSPQPEKSDISRKGAKAQRKKKAVFGTKGTRIRVNCIPNLRALRDSFENTSEMMYRRIQSTTLHSTPITAGTAYSVIPAKAGIQANWNGERTWIPACAGMTRCGENVQREAPFSFCCGRA
jgi:hypothetical protein